MKVISSWNLIRAENREEARLRRMVKDVADILRASGKISSSKGHIFTADFHRFLKFMRQRGLGDPEEIFVLIMQNHDLADFILHKKYNDLMAAVKQVSGTESNKELVFITTFYDGYYKTKSFVRAVLQAAHNPFTKIDRVFVYNVFKRYPYLRTEEHLRHICGMLDRVSFAYNLTQNGIKEVYECN